MRLKCLGCDALARPIYLCAAQSPHIVDVTLQKLGLHQDPDDLRRRLQAAIDHVDEQEYDAVALVYGLCGKATDGLRAGDVPIVMPRAHDCITLFLGDRERYAAEHRGCPGTYWYALDYIERRDSKAASPLLGSGMDSEISSAYDGYVEKYGKDNADYLMEVMGAWQDHYNRAVYVDMGIGDGSTVEALARAEAERRGWEFQQAVGDLVLVRRLLFGDWDEDFLVLQPGQRVGMATHAGVIEAAA